MSVLQTSLETNSDPQHCFNCPWFGIPRSTDSIKAGSETLAINLCGLSQSYVEIIQDHLHFSVA